MRCSGYRWRFSWSLARWRDFVHSELRVSRCFQEDASQRRYIVWDWIHVKAIRCSGGWAPRRRRPDELGYCSEALYTGSKYSFGSRRRADHSCGSFGPSYRTYERLSFDVSRKRRSSYPEGGFFANLQLAEIGIPLPQQMDLL